MQPKNSSSESSLHVANPKGGRSLLEAISDKDPVI
jgi:hypothetical protein